MENIISTTMSGIKNLHAIHTMMQLELDYLLSQ